MCELTKLEVGKTYVFKDDVSKSLYLNHYRANKYFFSNYYKDGFTVSTITDEGDGCYEDGNTVILIDEMKYFKLKEENVMPINTEDEVTITTTYRELARVYAILGKVDGAPFSSLFNQVVALLDPDYKKYSKLIQPIDKLDVLNYYSYQFSWEALLFSGQETQQQIQIRELREQAEALLQKAKELEGTK